LDNFVNPNKSGIQRVNDDEVKLINDSVENNFVMSYNDIRDVKTNSPGRYLLF
jgi:hypothetical protein